MASPDKNRKMFREEGLTKVELPFVLTLKLSFL